jgi:hypothetical protein
MKNILAWCKSLFSDEKGHASSKRFVGILCAVSLCITMYNNSFSDEKIAPSVPLVESVALLAFGCLGLSSVDKFTSRKTKQDEPQQPID